MPFPIPKRPEFSTMTTALRTTAAALGLALSTLASAQTTTLLNVSYDVAREFYKDINSAFVEQQQKAGKAVVVNQSHAGSSAQARAVADGLEADVVTFNTTTDVDFLADKGVVAKDWRQKFPNGAAPTTSTMLFLVRNGNPKNIKDWPDLIKPGVQVVVVNPKTGGNGRMAYLAAWGYVRSTGGTDAQAAEFVSKLYKNVPVLARGGRDATGKRPRRPSAQANNNASPEVVGSASGGSIMARKQSRAPEDVPSMKSSALSELVGSARRGSTMARKRDRDAEDEDAEGGHRVVKRRRTPMEWFGFASLFGEIEA